MNVPVYFRYLKRGINSFNLVNSRVLMIVGLTVVQTFIIIENSRYQLLLLLLLLLLLYLSLLIKKQPNNQKNQTVFHWNSSCLELICFDAIKKE